MVLLDHENYQKKRFYHPFCGMFRCGMFWMWDILDVGCLGCGIFRMWNVWEMRSWGCRMLGIKRYLGCGKFGVWDVRDVRFSRCRMFWIWYIKNQSEKLTDSEKLNYLKEFKSKNLNQL